MSTNKYISIEIPYSNDSSRLFSRIRSLPYACWLDSGKPHSHYGRYDIITAAPHQRFETHGSSTHIYQSTGNSLNDTNEQLIDISETTPWQLVDTAIQHLTTLDDNCELPFTGGALGYFGYDLGRKQNIEPDTATPLKACQLADMHIGIYFWAIIQDHHTQKSYLAALPECPPNTLEEVYNRIIIAAEETAPDKQNALHIDTLTANTQQAEYTQKLQRIDEYIHAGDCYQVNFTQCFHATYQGDPYYAYLKLRKAMASPYSAFISMKNKTILSLSPERFIQIIKNKVLTQPIKGTAPRHINPTIDQQHANHLQTSSKDRAENLMIVDLLRNDLGKNCVPGSIEVPTLFKLESYPDVHHLVSSITGEIAKGKSAIDVLQGCFPGGSITGAPKKRAMEIIDELEHYQRSVYCGSIAYINTKGDMDSNITIRTVACDSESLYCWGGGGIVADSDTDDEYQESLTKIASLLATLEEFNQKNK